ncbi:phosphoenolpyruvate carboxykinase (ATP) [Amorphus orientalis]|uniref:Phosphoenolpyruvate carboxykinase (ATP) n=1 Tax=Amorphus orientalis TaxID=649198 RepID=A0AAE3VRC2_9HYPH|nr:phosphoenolpyruvate carboxykinase (ATP) [Amorphus orientalis]
MRNPNAGIETIGLAGLASIHWNQSAPSLYEQAIRRNEGQLTAAGTLAADTGVHTGRSPKDKFVVRDSGTEDQIWWDNNKAMEPAAFDRLLEDMRDHAKGMNLFGQDLYGGADPDYRINVRVYTEYAWHSLFIRNLLIRPDRDALTSFVPDLTIIDLPSFSADPERHGCRSETVIACDFTRKIILIAGTSYAGEMKKSVFTLLNYLLPPKNVMPMHCSANLGANGDTAVFFGLSGTGKTTLSADPKRKLIGDDEHGWSENGVFNFEGGSYAKMIKLSQEAEPQIWAATHRFGVIYENVTIDPDTREPNFDDGSKTENTRGAYPIEFMPNIATGSVGPNPKNIIMLTADAFGVMPPIAKLTPAQAMYHFLSGYTAKIAGTEKGVTDPEATFSTCFGAPFLPRHPVEYGNLLRELIARHEVDCWLLNTGWTGGAHGVGHRMPISATRTLLDAALDGSLHSADYRTDPNFGFAVPVSVPGVDSKILDPRSTWDDKAGYDRQAARLVGMFVDNFARFADHVDASVLQAAPELSNAAE